MLAACFLMPPKQQHPSGRDKRHQQQQPHATTKMPRRAQHTEPAVEIEFEQNAFEQNAFRDNNNNNNAFRDSNEYDGPVDLDELFFGSQAQQTPDDGSLFSDDDDVETDTLPAQGYGKYFANPHKRLLDTDASLIPGSPFSKPPNRRSNRPAEPLSIAKYASTVAFLITVAWVVFLLMVPFWKKLSVGRIIVEMILALLSFFGMCYKQYYVRCVFVFVCVNAINQWLVIMTHSLLPPLIITQVCSGTATLSRPWYSSASFPKRPS